MRQASGLFEAPKPPLIYSDRQQPMLRPLAKRVWGRSGVTGKGNYYDTAIAMPLPLYSNMQGSSGMFVNAVLGAQARFGLAIPDDLYASEYTGGLSIVKRAYAGDPGTLHFPPRLTSGRLCHLRATTAIRSEPPRAMYCACSISATRKAFSPEPTAVPIYWAKTRPPLREDFPCSTAWKCRCRATPLSAGTFLAQPGIRLGAGFKPAGWAKAWLRQKRLTPSGACAGIPQRGLGLWAILCRAGADAFAGFCGCAVADTEGLWGKEIRLRTYTGWDTLPSA